MKQSILMRPQKSQVEERDIPSIGAKDVLVKVLSCGVCASELHRWLGDKKPYPRELGHEVAGEVVEVGKEVTDFRAGMHVTGLFHKGFADYAIAPDSLVTRVPENVDLDVALGEPLSCVISAARRTSIELGDTVAIIGLGFMGLLMLQAIRLKGPGRILAIDTRKEMLEAAQTFGADEVLLPEQVGKQLKLTKWKQLHKGFGVDVVIEASGTQPGLSLAGEMVKEHGTLSILGYHQGAARRVNMELWNWKALSVLNAHERRAVYQMDCMRRGLELLASGKLEMKSLISHSYSLEQVDEAFRALAEKPGGFRKAVIRPAA